MSLIISILKSNNHRFTKQLIDAKQKTKSYREVIQRLISSYLEV